MRANGLLAVSVMVGERVAGRPAAAAVTGRQIGLPARTQPPHDVIDDARGLAQVCGGVPSVHQLRHILVVVALLRILLDICRITSFLVLETQTVRS